MKIHHGFLLILGPTYLPLSSWMLSPKSRSQAQNLATQLLYKLWALVCFKARKQSCLLHIPSCQQIGDDQVPRPGNLSWNDCKHLYYPSRRLWAKVSDELCDLFKSLPCFGPSFLICKVKSVISKVGYVKLVEKPRSYLWNLWKPKKDHTVVLEWRTKSLWLWSWIRASHCIISEYGLQIRSSLRTSADQKFFMCLMKNIKKAIHY
jgi:hypothetical protein